MSSTPQGSGVCVYSFHPLVLLELERVFADRGVVCESYRLEPSQILHLDQLPVPSMATYVIEANGRRRATETVVEEILLRNPAGKILVLADGFDEVQAFALLRLGVKGLILYEKLPDLVRAVEEVSSGGLWVPRSLVARFLDSVLGEGTRRSRVVRVNSHLSRREREVHSLLMENCSNKEIAARLHMSERTVKFHVSNLLTKHGVKRRLELIVLSLTESRPA